MEMFNKITVAKEILGNDYNVIKELCSKKVSEDSGSELFSPDFLNDIATYERKIGELFILGKEDTNPNTYKKLWAESVALWDGAKAEETKWM